MTIDQILTLLAILAWPTVAVIAGVAFVHGIRLVVEVVADQHGRGRFHLAAEGAKNRDVAFRLIDLLVLASSKLLERESRTAEEALLAVLSARGGLPVGEPGAEDQVVRQLVREVRRMYDELRNPTPEPERRTPESGAEDELERIFGPLDAYDADDDPDEPTHAEFTEAEEEL